MSDARIDALLKLPNPFTPMAFLPPQLATQFTTGTYIMNGACAVFVFDILDNLRDDYRLVTEARFKIRLPTVVYVISRLGTLGLVVTTSLYQSAALTTNCARFFTVLAAFYPITIPATSLLFFLRLRAVFDRNRIVVGVFAFIWFSLFASSFAVPFGLKGANIGPTKYCIPASAREFIVLPSIVSLIHDTLVLFAISWRLMTITHIDPDVRKGVKTMVFGDYLPSFSRGLLHDGQKFYSATVSLSLLTVVMFFVHSVPPIYRLMFAVPNLALMNIMACRVYRNTKFGRSNDSMISTSFINPRDAGLNVMRPALSLRFNVNDQTNGRDITLDSLHDSSCHRESPSEPSLVIHIAKKVTVDCESQHEYKVDPDSDKTDH